MRWWKKLLIGFLCILLFLVAAGVIGWRISVARRAANPVEMHGYVNSDTVRVIEDAQEQGIGRVAVRTLPLDESIRVSVASYLSSGRVIIAYYDQGSLVFCTLNDDGSDMREIYHGAGAGSLRVLPFRDNTRVLLGDSVLEVPEGKTLDTCGTDEAFLVPVTYPEEIVKAQNVQQAWSEIIIAGDNTHIAWTTLRTDCGAVAAMGELERREDGYVIVDACYISAMNGYTPDATDSKRLTAIPAVGGEVKQFIHGDAAISFVGADTNGMADSVAVDLASGAVTRITRCPGYDETTIFSPSEEYGITMTTRFSPATDLAVLGLVPRPHGDALYSIMSQIYMYDVTGVRAARAGNIGPALIHIARSIAEDDYLGIDLSDPEGNWVYNSPMSWNSDSTRAMWMEQEREHYGIRVQIAELMDAQPKAPVAVDGVPAVGDWADQEVSAWSGSGRVQGKASGYMDITKSTSALLHNTKVEITYADYSDDGETFYNGTEKAAGGMTRSTVYEANLTLTDKDGMEIGGMDVKLQFTAAVGLKTLFGRAMTPDLDVNASHGRAWYLNRTLTAEALIE